jgi:hypothetical protein
MTLPTESSITAIFEKLFEVMQSDRFLQSDGLGNEVPLYIQPYPAAAQNLVDTGIQALTQRLTAAGENVLSINLLEMVYEMTSEGNRLQRLLEKEPTMDPEKMLSTMARWTDAKEHLVPAITARFASQEWRVAIIHGCGAVFPYLRIHTILENLQPHMDSRPVVFFFPGEYMNREAAGSELRLFGCLPHKGYYRAFNLDHYHL